MDLLHNILPILKVDIQKKLEKEIDVLLFGSAARGEATPESDVDILVLVEGTMDRQQEFEIMDIAYETGLAHDLVFGVLVYSKDFWKSQKARSMPLYSNIQKEGIRI